MTTWNPPQARPIAAATAPATTAPATGGTAGTGTLVAGVLVLVVLALPPIGMACILGIFALAYGEFGLLALAALGGVLVTLPVAVFAGAANRARTSGRLGLLLVACVAVALVPFLFASTQLG